MLCLIKLFNGKLILISDASYIWVIFHKFQIHLKNDFREFI